MSIDYVHSQNGHSIEGPDAAFPYVAANVGSGMTSLVDVGCGTGPWLRAARKHGIHDVVGIDGVACPDEELAVDRSLIRICDLTGPLRLGRRFDVALCLEVAEHLDECHAAGLIKSLTQLADVVVFSAACPNQPGQHHVNCQWPSYWQKIFNSYHYSCEDKIRWALWPIAEIEPWYRQNMFVARRDPVAAGTEPRLLNVVHPELALCLATREVRELQLREVSHGSLPVHWYLTVPVNALLAKLGRRLPGQMRFFKSSDC